MLQRQRQELRHSRPTSARGGSADLWLGASGGDDRSQNERSVGQAECCWDTEPDREGRGGEAGQSMEERAHSQGLGQQEHTCVLGRQSGQEWRPDQSSKKMEPKWEVAGLIQGKEEVPRAGE